MTTDTTRLIARRRRQDVFFNVAGILCMLVGIVTLGALLIDLAADGLTRINWQFLSSYPSSDAARAGVLAGWVGSLLLMLVTVVVAVPLGIAAGVYLEEYAHKNWMTTIIEINIANLAGVPSIIYGLMGLGILVYYFHLGQSLLSGGITLAFLILPIVIVATRESLRAIPNGIREAAYADEERVLQILDRLPDGLTEIFFHPATRAFAGADPGTERFQWSGELAALTSPRVRAAIARQDIANVTYGELAAR